MSIGDSNVGRHKSYALLAENNNVNTISIIECSYILKNLASNLFLSISLKKKEKNNLSEDNKHKSKIKF